MKALILAAGFGTRLLPYSSHTPKPLFTLAGKSMLELAIEKLLDAGCSRIVVNTHHLHDSIKNFLKNSRFKDKVVICREPEILGTGGAIKNVRSFMGDDPFFVVNSDILSCVNLRKVLNFHLNGDWPVTLVLSDSKPHNKVWVTKEGIVKGFTGYGTIKAPGLQTLAFTGVQLISPAVLESMPKKQCFSSIEFYQSLCCRDNCCQGDGVRAFVDTKTPWADMGTPEVYGTLALSSLAYQAMGLGGPAESLKDANLKIEPLAGDGSDRQWYRAETKSQTVIIADHGIGIKRDKKPREVEAFVSIGNHLIASGLPLPRILAVDFFSGLVALEDLGETHLQDRIAVLNKEEKILETYMGVCDLLVDLSLKGKKGFDTSWTHQTPCYSRDVILEKECRYFVEAFLNNYLGMGIRFCDLEDDFTYLAQGALENSLLGFMHRDFQSRNIMVKNDNYYFIDFQGGRLGPMQYDLASLLIDPYVGLASKIQEELLSHTATRACIIAGFDPGRFKKGYQFCKITRNLQILGAFSHLTMVKGKKQFERYIPAAISSLKDAGALMATQGMDRLGALITGL